MVLIYAWFLTLLVAIAKFNKELIDDIVTRTGGSQKENNEWHQAQLLQWILIFLMPMFTLFISNNMTDAYEYGIRLIFFGLMFSGVYNITLNVFRGIYWLHYGTNDFLSTEDLLIIAIIGFIFSVLYEIGAIEFIRWWV